MFNSDVFRRSANPQARNRNGLAQVPVTTGESGFTGAELVSAFVDLVAWVELGIKPAGDDFLDPAAVADPDFGCAFTDFGGAPAHILATPCP